MLISNEIYTDFSFSRNLLLRSVISQQIWGVVQALTPAWTGVKDFLGEGDVI